MPRKNPFDVRHVINLLKYHGGIENCQIVPIEGKSEKQIYDYLKNQYDVAFKRNKMILDTTFIYDQKYNTAAILSANISHASLQKMSYDLSIKSDSLYLELITTDSTDAQAYNNFAYSLVERHDNLELALEMSIKLDLDGRYLIRNSGTEPLLRVLVEARSQESMENFSEELLSKINNYLN